MTDTTILTDDDIFEIVARELNGDSNDLRAGFVIRAEPNDWIKVVRAAQSEPATRAVPVQKLVISKGDRNGNYQEYSVNGHGGMIRVVARMVDEDEDLPLGNRVETFLLTAPTPDSAVPVASYVDIVFDGPPCHESGRFVEVESPAGRSINFGEWIHRDDGYWALRFAAPTPDAERHVANHAGDLAVPKGWKMVPIEPTQEMIIAGWKNTQHWHATEEDVERSYKAAILAAPAQPTDKENGK